MAAEQTIDRSLKDRRVHTICIDDLFYFLSLVRLWSLLFYFLSFSNINHISIVNCKTLDRNSPYFNRHIWRRFSLRLSMVLLIRIQMGNKTIGRICIVQNARLKNNKAIRMVHCVHLITYDKLLWTPYNYRIIQQPISKHWFHSCWSIIQIFLMK